jgi:hypothetical protein
VTRKKQVEKLCQINTPNDTYAELQSSLDVSKRNDCEGYRLAGSDVLQFYKQELGFGTKFLSQHLQPRKTETTSSSEILPKTLKKPDVSCPLRPLHSERFSSSLRLDLAIQ